MSSRPDQRPMRALPILEAERAPLETCTFCPKLCRSACPVSNAEPNETLTPWGKMMTTYVTALGDAPLSTELASPAWACTGCGACAKSCDHDNDVAGTLLSARSAFQDRGVAPAAASRVLARFDAHRSATREACSKLASEPSRTGLLVGCTYARRCGAEAADAVSAARALLGPVRVLDECCGLPLLQAGGREAFEAHARALSTRLEGLDSIVVVDPGCGVALRQDYPRAGAALPRVTMLVEEAALRLRSLSPLDAAPSVRWHDPCKLGRGLGLYDEPRAVLTRILNRAPEENLGSREHGRCSGGGGLLPVTMPGVSRAIAAERAAEHETLGSGELVTACASSLLSLRKAAAGRFPVSDLVTWLARSLR